MMSMVTGKKGIALIKEFESYQPRAYKCAAGKMTAGYGHVIRQNELHLLTDVLSEAQADSLLRRDLTRFEKAVNKYITADLAQHKFDAIVCWCFNVGTHALKTSTLRKKVNLGAMDVVPAEFLRWDKATVNGKKVRLAGLTRRREAEARLFNGGHI